MLESGWLRWFWFLGGLGAGSALLGAAHAAPAPILREIPSKPVQVSGRLEQEFDLLSRSEARFVESPQQIQRLKSRSLRAAGPAQPRKRAVR